MTSQNVVTPMGVMAANTSYAPAHGGYANYGPAAPPRPTTQYSHPAPPPPPPTQYAQPAQRPYAPPTQYAYPPAPSNTRPYAAAPQAQPPPNYGAFAPPPFGVRPPLPPYVQTQTPPARFAPGAPPWVAPRAPAPPAAESSDDSSSTDDDDSMYDSDDEQSSTSFTVRTPAGQPQQFGAPPSNRPLPNATDFLRWAASRPLPLAMQNRAPFAPPPPPAPAYYGPAPTAPSGGWHSYGTGNARAAPAAQATAHNAPQLPTTYENKPVDNLPDWNPATFRTPSTTLILGPSGSGKTNVLSTMVAAIGNRFDLVIMITEAIDTVRAFTERSGPMLENILIFHNCWTQTGVKLVTDLINVLDELSRENQRDPTVEVPSVLLILDDLLCSPSAKKWPGWAELLKRLHHCNLTTFLATQFSTDLNPDMRANVHNLVVLRHSNENDLIDTYKRLVDPSIPAFATPNGFVTACLAMHTERGRGFFIDTRSFSSTHLSAVITKDPRITPLRPRTLCSVDVTILLALHGQMAQKNKAATRAAFKTMADNPAYRKTMSGMVDAATGAPLIDPAAAAAAEAQAANAPTMLAAGGRVLAYTGNIM